MRWSILIALCVLILAGSCLAEWERTYSELGYDQAYSAVQTSDSGYIVTGFTAYRNQSLWLYKLNPLGDVVWSRVYEDALPTKGYSVIQASPGDGMAEGYMVVGSYGNEIGGPPGVLAIRTDLNGDTLWTRKWNGSWGHYAAYINDAYLLAGHGGSDNDAEIIKFTDSGDTLWTRYFGLPDGWPDAAFSVVPAANGEDGYAFTGYTITNNNPNSSDFWFVRIDNDGSFLWDRTYLEGVGFAMIQSGDGYVITGRNEWTAYAMKIDASGSVIWENWYPGNVCRSIMEDSDGGYVIAGYKTSHNYDRDLWFFKIDADGNLLWERTFNFNNHDDMSWSVAPTISGDYLLAGYAKTDQYRPDAYVILTPGEQSSINETQAQVLDRLELSVYPNPFNSSVMISASEGNNVEIYDITGRLIHNMPINTRINTSAVWNPDKIVGSGVYFVRVKTGDKAVVKRVVYLK